MLLHCLGVSSREENDVPSSHALNALDSSERPVRSYAIRRLLHLDRIHVMGLLGNTLVSPVPFSLICESELTLDAAIKAILG